MTNFCAPAETLERMEGPGEVSKEVAGIQVLLTYSLFAADILRKSLRRVFLATLTSAPVRF